jgi:hypothetical protein
MHHFRELVDARFCRQIRARAANVGSLGAGRKAFFKDEGKDFELTGIGKDRFAFEQGELIFVPNARGEIEHIFMGLYAARKIS